MGAKAHNPTMDPVQTEPPQEPTATDLGPHKAGCQTPSEPLPPKAISEFPIASAGRIAQDFFRRVWPVEGSTSGMEGPNQKRNNQALHKSEKAAQPFTELKGDRKRPPSRTAVSARSAAPQYPNFSGDKIMAVDGDGRIVSPSQTLPAEEAWRQQAQIISQIHDAVVSTDLDGHVTSWNGGAERMFGYPANEVLGQHISFVYSPEQHAYLQNEVIQPLKARGQHNVEVWMQRKCGEPFCADLSLSLLRNAQGMVTGMIGYSKDITARKRVEEALRQRSHQQAALVRLGQEAQEFKNLSDLLDRAVVLLAETLEVEFCKVLELQPNGKMLRLRAGVGWKPGRVGHAKVSSGYESQAGYTLWSAGPVIVDDFRSEKRFRCPPLLRQHGMVSGVSVIIGGHPQPFGILGAHCTQRRQFTAYDIHFLQAAAYILAQSIDSHRANQALQERELAFRTLTENLPGIVFRVFAREGKQIKFFSKASEAIIGYPAESLSRGKCCPLESIMLPEDRPRVRKLLKEAARLKRPFTLEYRIRHPDGAVRCLLERGTPISDEEGKLLYFDGVILDQTERHQAEEALRTEHAFRTAVENSIPAGIAAVDLDGRLIYVNPALCTMLGWSAHELLGSRTPYVFWPPEELERIGQVNDLITMGATPRDGVEVRLQRRNGERFWASVTSSPLIDRAGNRIGAAGTIFDITERKRLEEAVLEISERERRRFGQDLHDGLSQHLRGIAYLSQVLHDQLAQRGVAEAADAARITHLLDQALSQAQHLARGLQPVDIDEYGLMAALRELAAGVSNIYPVACRFVCPQPVRIQDNATAVHLFRIAQEAVQNALRHAQAKCIRIHLAHRANRVTLTVQDDGRGLPRRPPAHGGMGWRTMQYRAATIGATVRLEAAPRGGVLVTCSLRIGTARAGKSTS